MTTNVLEVIRMSHNGNGLFLVTENLPLPESVDPLHFVSNLEPDALTHSTSWRWSNDSLFLTFVQVFKDSSKLPQDSLARGKIFVDPAALPSVECHAIRHLYFLLHTDEEIAVSDGLEGFWDFAHAVVDIHHPAVAGLIDSPNH